MTPSKRAILLRQIFRDQDETGKGEFRRCKIGAGRIVTLDNPYGRELLIALQVELPNGEKGLLPVDMDDIRRWKRLIAEYKSAWVNKACGEDVMVQLYHGGSR